MKERFMRRFANSTLTCPHGPIFVFLLALRTPQLRHNASCQTDRLSRGFARIGTTTVRKREEVDQPLTESRLVTAGIGLGIPLQPMQILFDLKSGTRLSALTSTFHGWVLVPYAGVAGDW